MVVLTRYEEECDEWCGSYIFILLYAEWKVARARVHIRVYVIILYIYILWDQIRCETWWIFMKFDVAIKKKNGKNGKNRSSTSCENHFCTGSAVVVYIRVFFFFILFFNYRSMSYDLLYAAARARVYVSHEIFHIIQSGCCTVRRDCSAIIYIRVEMSLCGARRI